MIPSLAPLIVLYKTQRVTAHAGEPEKGINPALAIASIINQFDAIIQPDISKVLSNHSSLY
jgi:metal-dependent amidase/aminoacylase/carboxypeptidase family protein